MTSIDNHQPVLCVFHGSCPDGFTAAWVVDRALARPVDLHEGRYGDPPPDCTGRDVYIVDFSYPRADMQRIADQAASVTVFDHHQTAIEALAGFAAPNVRLVLDDGRSGCRITWDELVGGDPPDFVAHVEDRDLWRHHLDGTAEVFANVTSRPYTLDEWDLLGGTPIGDVIAEGAAILRKDRQVIAWCAGNARPMVIGGVEVPVANTPYSVGSDVAGQLAVGQSFAGYYYDTETARCFGLRSAGDGADVAQVAQAYGGGGHRHAAGFKVPRWHPLATV